MTRGGMVLGVKPCMVRFLSWILPVLSLAVLACSSVSPSSPPASAAASQEASPASPTSPTPSARGPIVGERIPVAVGNPKELARNLQMIFDAGSPKSQVSAVLVDEATNELLVLGTEEGILAVRRLIDPLNRHEAPQEPLVEVLRLDHADARDVAHTLSPVLKGRPTVSVDAPTNSLVIQGSPEERAQAKSLVAKLDIPRRSGSNGTPSR